MPPENQFLIPPRLAVFAVILSWGLCILSSIVLACGRIAKKDLKGISWSLLMMFGALCLGGFVSAVIGLYELRQYYADPRFSVSVAVGIFGIALFVYGGLQLRK